MHAKSKATPKCATTYEQATAKGRDLVAKNPAVEFDDYSGDDAAKLLAALNAQPPVTHLLAEHILVVEMATQDDEDSRRWPWSRLCTGAALRMSSGRRTVSGSRFWPRRWATNLEDC